MKARSRGTVVVLAAGLVLAVAVPANAVSSGTSMRSIMTAVKRGDSITMGSGDSKYLYVGGSSANAIMSDSSFGGFGLPGCGTRRPGKGPLGTSASPQGSFSTNGSEAAIAGIGVSGYSVRRAPGSPNPGASGTCDTDGISAPQPDGGEVIFGTTKHVAGTVLVLIGTAGEASLTGFTLSPGYLPGGMCNPIKGLRVVRNVTYGNPKSTIGLGRVASVAVLSVALPAGNSCSLDFSSTDVPLGNFYNLYLEAFLLEPTATS